MTPDEFHPYIRVDALDCPDPVINSAVISASIEFCRDTLSWTEMQDYLPLVNGVADYEIDAPANSRVIQVMDIWLNSSRIEPVTLKDLQRLMPNWSVATASAPSYFTSAVERGAIRLFPRPMNVDGQRLTARIALVPTAKATTLPDFLGLHYFEVIASGAKARLMMMPSTSWFNAALAMTHRQLFADGVVSARIAELHDRTPSTVSVPYRKFGF
jgi:hypothetical protein